MRVRMISASLFAANFTTCGMWEIQYSYMNYPNRVDIVCVGITTMRMVCCQEGSLVYRGFPEDCYKI